MGSLPANGKVGRMAEWQHGNVDSDRSATGLVTAIGW